MSAISFSRDWPKFVTEKRRLALLQILDEISRLFRLNAPPFILVGACSLLIRGCLQYKAWWDVDLLFASLDDLGCFHKLPKNDKIQIFPVDKKPVNYEYLSSMQSMWGVQNIWYRVDYIFKDNYYHFHSHVPENSNLYDFKTKDNHKSHHFTMFIAHPWNIFIEKLLSPRFEFEFKSRDGFSIDIRHLFILFEKYKEDSDFWVYLSRKSSDFGQLGKVKTNLKSLLDEREQLGYGSIEISKQDVKKISSL